MRFKEIKPGMAIRCDSSEENTMLLEELERLGYKWGREREKPTELIGYKEGLIFTIQENYMFGIGFSFPVTHSFSELIIKELTKDELTNEEVIELLAEILISINLSDYVFGDSMCTFSDLTKDYTPNDIIAHLVEYKKEKVIKIVSKSEYNKVASDKLDELYPKGWMVEE